MLDFYFYYKNVMRFILILKKSKIKYDSIDILELKKSVVFFNLKNIVDLNSLSISNYYFFFKYFFGKIPYFSSYKYKFKLNVNYYDFIISYHFKKKEIYYILNFFLNDIYTFISKNSIKIKKELNYWDFTVNDMNFFIEKKNSIGFFHLKDNVNFRFIFNIEGLNYFLLYKVKG